MKKYELYNKINDYQHFHSKADLEILITQFEPLLKKYAYKLSYTEDSIQDLTVSFIEIMRKIPLDQIKDEKHILAYITSAIKNKYIKISTINSKYSKFIYESDILENTIKEEADDDINRVEMLDLLNILSNKEKYILYCIFFKNISILSISKKLHTSRQYINQTKLNALMKLKRELV